MAAAAEVEAMATAEEFSTAASFRGQWTRRGRLISVKLGHYGNAGIHADARYISEKYLPEAIRPKEGCVSKEYFVGEAEDREEVMFSTKVVPENRLIALK